MRVSYDAKRWLKNNLDLDYDNMKPKGFNLLNARKSVSELDRNLTAEKLRP
jgi:hypothetical protein